MPVRQPVLVGEAEACSRPIGRTRQRIRAGGEVIAHITDVITRADFAAGPLAAGR